MRRILLAGCVLVGIGCASRQATKPVSSPAATTQLAAKPCPKIFVDGVEQRSTCAGAKRPTAKCDPKGPTIVVDGIKVDCVQPEKGD